MAKAKKTEKPDEGKRGELKALLARIRERFKVMTEADDTNRRLAMDDLKFVHEPGAQWDPGLKKERGKRPCYEFNKLRITIKRVINHIRANRPTGKVRAVEDGDKDTADVYDGLIRNIWNVSDADTVVDYAAEYVVAAGMGAWRVTTEYSDDTAFNQDIFVRPIKNPFCLYADPAASDPLKRDAEDWILTENISNKAFDEKWPKAKRISFDDVSFDDDAEWQDENTTRICEYWYKQPYDKTLVLLADGKAIDKKDLPPDAPDVQIVRERVVRCHKIYSVIASGEAILEGPNEWAGSKFPFVQVHGEWRVIDGKVQWHGLTRFSKDAQREYNSSRTAIAEAIQLAPTAKWWMTVDQAKGLEKPLADAHKENFPYALYNADPKAPGAPQRMGGTDIPVALIQEAQLSSEDIKATSGIFDASLGKQSNETSGIAIRQRQEQGEIATYNYPDNISKGVRLTNEIIIDLLPHIYDTARSIRILGSDGAEKYAKINEPVQNPDGSITVLNDVTRGKYDVTVTSGPSFSTQRQEAAEVYTAIGQAVPALWGVAGDLVVKSMDLPYSEDIAERMKALLPPQVQQQIAEGKPVPPEVQALMNQAQQAMMVVQQQSQLVQEAAKEAEEQQHNAEKAEAQVKQAIADLKVAQAQFEAKVAKELASIAQKEAGLSARESGLEVKGAQLESQSREIDSKIQQTGVVDQAVENIAGIADEFTKIAGEIMGRLDQVEQVAATVPPPAPKTTRRVNAQRGAGGELAFTVEDVDELGQVVGSRSGRVSRQNGGLVGEIV